MNVAVAARRMAVLVALGLSIGASSCGSEDASPGSTDAASVDADSDGGDTDGTTDASADTGDGGTDPDVGTDAEPDAEPSDVMVDAAPDVEDVGADVVEGDVVDDVPVDSDASDGGSDTDVGVDADADAADDTGPDADVTPPECREAADCGVSTDCLAVDCVDEACVRTPADAFAACDEDGAVVCDGAGACVPGTCMDGGRGGAETGIDCGGPDCGPCDAGSGCVEDDDCASALCLDGVPDGDAEGDRRCEACERADDCGDGRYCDDGVCRATLDLGEVCEASEDCASGFCADGVCCDGACDGACEACSAEGACETVADDTPCDGDGLFCTGVEVCLSGACVSPGDPCPGADGDADCSETCDEAADSCSAPDGAGLPCDDGLFCTATDVCNAAGICFGSGAACPGADGDGDCTESCNEAADDCSLPDPVDSACNDGLFCTRADSCNATGTCVGSGDPCPGADGDADCSEGCDEGTDSCTANDAAGAFCDDGNFCDGADTCNGSGACVGAGNPCPGADGDADCTETCNEIADACTAADPDGSTCGATSLCEAGTCTAITSKTVFVTSRTYAGNFGSAAAADAICQGVASSAGLPGTYRSWTSDRVSSPSSRFSRSLNPYVLTNGTQIADNWTDLVDGSLDAPINRSETGALIGTGSPNLGTNFVWTGTSSAGGGFGGFNCNDWTSTSDRVSIQGGDTSLRDGNWSTQWGVICSISGRLYCFQQ